MKAKLILATIATVVLSGCATRHVEVKPVPFDDNHSYAYNIASQTFLMQNDSPLRDFTVEEVEASKAKMHKSSSGSTSFLMGGISILTGNLMGGAISVAGGGAAELANSKHDAALPQWIVAIDANDASSGIEANYQAMDLIIDTALDLLKESGNTFHPQARGRTTINGDKYSFGPVQKSHQLGGAGNPFLEGKTNLIDAEWQYVSQDELYAAVMGFMPFIDNQVKGYEGYEGWQRYLLELTSRLPKGYFLYIPSYVQDVRFTVEKAEDWDCITCKSVSGFQLFKHDVPAIYTQGEKHEFLLPE